MDPILMSPEEQIAFLRTFTGIHIPQPPKPLPGYQSVAVPFGMRFDLYADIVRRRFSEFHFDRPELKTVQWQTLRYAPEPMLYSHWEQLSLERPNEKNLADGVSFGAIMLLCLPRTQPDFLEIAIPGVRILIGKERLVPHITAIGKKFLFGVSRLEDLSRSPTLMVPCASLNYK